MVNMIDRLTLKFEQYKNNISSRYVIKFDLFSTKITNIVSRKLSWKCVTSWLLKVSEWMNNWKKSFDSQRKKSRLIGDCRSYFSVSLEATQFCRATGNPYESISGVNGEGVTFSHFCYAFLPDDDNDVWVRELSCPGCATCADPDFMRTFPLDTNPGCENSDICGKWTRYPILKTGEKDPRKQGKNGDFDGKRMYVPIDISFSKTFMTCKFVFFRFSCWCSCSIRFVMLRSVENVIDSHKALPTTFNMFLHLILMQEGRMLTLLKVWISFYRYGKFLSWDQLQRFYLSCKRVCPKKQHTMGCIVKLMPHWYVTRASISITFDFSDLNWFF